MVLTKRQLDFIEYLLANPRVPDYTCADRYGIPRSTLHDWKNRPEFMDELRKRLREQWEDSRRTAQNSMEDLAREGNFNASKYILDNLGYGATQKIDLDQTIQIEVGIEE